MAISAGRLGNIVFGCVLAAAMGGLYLTLGNSFNPALHKFLNRHLPGQFPDSITGIVTASGDVGNWTIHPNACFSGETKEYFGFEFYDESQPQSGGQLVVPPDTDSSVTLNSSKGGTDTFHRDDCQVWDVDLHRTNTRYNAIWGLDGHAKFDCQFHDPDSRITADLTVHECH